MKAVIIDVSARQVKDVVVPNRLDFRYKVFQKIVGGLTDEDYPTINGRLVVVGVQDNSIHRRDLDYFSIAGYQHILPGNGYMYGITRDWKDVDLPFNAKQIAKWVQFHKKEDIHKRFSLKSRTECVNEDVVCAMGLTPDE